MKLVVGLVGGIASGKGVVSDFLAVNHGAVVYRFSDVLKSLLEKEGKPNTRENLQSLGVRLREAHGDSVLADILKKDIEKDGHSLIVVDGVRYWNEYQMVRSFKDNLIISITAPVGVRYQRAISRATRGEARITLEDFKKSESNETERLIDGISSKADLRIENTGSKEELIEKVKEALKDRLTP